MDERSVIRLCQVTPDDRGVSADTAEHATVALLIRLAMTGVSSSVVADIVRQRWGVREQVRRARGRGPGAA